MASVNYRLVLCTELLVLHQWPSFCHVGSTYKPLSIFQYKIIHNILPHGVLLHKMKIVNSPLCIHCDLLETLFHMLVNCIVIQKFWFEVISWWKNHSGECLLIDDLSVMYGNNPEDPKMHNL